MFLATFYPTSPVGRPREIYGSFFAKEYTEYPIVVPGSCLGHASSEELNVGRNYFPRMLAARKLRVNLMIVM